MSSRRKWGIGIPLVVSAVVVAMGCGFVETVSIQRGMTVGICLALLQSFLSLGALTWAWQRSFFYWVWGGGLLFRLIVFALTAFVVYSYTQLNLVATLLSMVLATTLFLVIESWAFFNKNGFSSSTRTSSS